MRLSQASPVGLVLDKAGYEVLHVKEALHQLGVAGTQASDGEVHPLTEAAGVAILALTRLIIPLPVQICPHTVGQLSTIGLTWRPVAIK